MIVTNTPVPGGSGTVRLLFSSRVRCMFTRRLVFRALLAGSAALGGPAAVAAQHPATLPLRATRALVVVDAWEGYSPIAPIQATYRLARSADGSFAGTVEIVVGTGVIRRDTSFSVRLPRAAADSLFQVLANVPLRQGSYRPTLTHTDDHPSITADLTVGDSVVRFRTTSQGAAHVPWQVIAGETSYVSGSAEIWPAFGRVLERVGQTEKRTLVEAAQRDPDAACGRGWADASQFSGHAGRPVYAANEAWFAQDSLITVEGRNYRKRGLPRIVGSPEVSPYATHRGVPVYQERGRDGPPEVLYVPVRSRCEVQAYVVEPRR